VALFHVLRRRHHSMEQYGNQTTFNLETVLKQNIGNADFYRNDCLKLNSWSDVVDQIFYQVRLEAATVFCLFRTAAATTNLD
jgi:hypothetical protein